MKKNEIFSSVEYTEWSCNTIEKQGKEYFAEFEAMTNGGQDIVVSVYSEKLTGLFDAIYDYYLSYDPDYEASLWIGPDGHGKNGAPYDLQDILDDMKDAKSMIYDLYKTVKGATWAAA